MNREESRAAVAAARRAHAEAIIADVLTDNFYRIARYDEPGMARPAIDNVAREIRERLTEGVIPA